MKQLTNDVITPLNWGKKIEAVRNRLGIHQIDLCIEAGISPYTYQKIKREEARQPAATFGMPAPRNDGRRIQGVLDGAGKLLGIMRVAYRRNNVNKNIIV